MNVCGILLAGGNSARFGRDKLSEPLEGMPLLNHAVARLIAVCDEVVVVLAPNDERKELPAEVRVVHDRVQGEGPLSGLQEGLLAAVLADTALVAGGDMPRLHQSVLRRMLEAIGPSDVRAVALEGPIGPLPLPMAVKTWPAAEATHALLHAGARALKDLLEVLKPVVIPQREWLELDPDRLTTLDIDEPKDLP